VSDLDFVQLTNENDPATCRGRAVHARLAAEESADQRIFRRLAELYDAKASKLEAVGSESKLFHSDEASEPIPPHQES
jgi:hypothetical protein